MSSKTEKKKLILLDAHAIIHRAYHALPDFTSPSGKPTGALYGLSAMLMRLVAELKPDYLIACYDLPDPTYRHDVYAGYKAKRPKTDDELIRQLDSSRDVFEAFNVPMYEHKGFEADDIIGTIVEEVKGKKDIEVVIASGDMDTLQLVSGKRVRVYTLRKGISDTIMYDEAAVNERFGFGPELLPDFKGLRGDPSDNIIGVPGIGEKTATELIREFGTIEHIYKQLKKNDKAFLEKGIKERVVKLLREHAEEAEFSKMLARIRRDAPIQFSLPKRVWSESFNPKEALELFTELGFRTLAERLRKQFAVEGGHESVALARDTNATIDEGEFKETSVALWLLRSDISNPSLEDILEYAKTNNFGKARQVIFKKLKGTPPERVYEEIERPLIPVTTRMNERGVSVDLAYLEKLSTEYHKDLSGIEARIFKAAGEKFNINSPRQLADILFDKLELRPLRQKKTATGQRSTRESELEKLRGQHPIIADILLYRELQKLLSTYIDNLPGMVVDGRLHATFVQAGTTTGRMSSQNPNLQNIPIKSDLGRRIRRAFVASDGFQLVALDYSQVELRIAAFLSGDEKLIEIFKKGGDVHAAVAATVFGVPPELVDAEMRRRAKVINFGILYGMGVNALQQNLETSRAEAQQFLNDYFKNFSGLAHYMERTKADAARRGYTETLFGRRRYFEGIRSTLPYIRAQAERMAINAPAQGTQADVIKIAMVRIDEFLKREQLERDAYLVLQVHDELVYEVRTEKLEVIGMEAKRIMESVLTIEETKGVPIIADASCGPNWGEMEKF
jgi:DNA polymerase-1